MKKRNGVKSVGLCICGVVFVYIMTSYFFSETASISLGFE